VVKLGKKGINKLAAILAGPDNKLDIVGGDNDTRITANMF
jgi:hypothetical protein